MGKSNFKERIMIMKKVLSLVLALLMLASLTVSAGAAKIISSNGSSSNSTNSNDPVSLTDLFNYYNSFYNSNSSDKFFPGVSGSNGVYTSWYGTCPECKGFAFFFVYAGDIRWTCLESKCGKTGTISAPGHDDDDDECTVSCPYCGKSSGVRHIDRCFNSETGKMEDKYLCVYCGKVFTKTTSVLPDYDLDDITCSNINCRRSAEFQYFFNKNGYLYARFECSKGHVTDKLIADYDYDEYFYTIRVITTRGGDYTVKGGEKAAWGETKTIVFEPDKGYVLTDVYVNGESVNFSDDQIKVEVRGNTVIRAYFTKVSELRSYTVTSTSTGGGKITATLNSKAVDPAKITAKYTDTITYRFTPASSNYSVDSVKVNGKSVGKVSTYTVSRLTSDTKIEVTFKWVCPYDDVDSSSKYYKAIEYVTEAGILTGTKTSTLKPQYNFNGSRAVSIKTFACALAEMADVKGILSNNTDRADWAVKYGLIGKKEDTSVVCDVQRACDMVKVYLEVLEDKNDISFVDVDPDDTAKETAIAIGMVTSSTYKKNRNLNKNDLAAVLYLISNLEYED